MTTFCAEPCVDVESLVRAAAGDDRDALARLLAVLQPKVIRYCRARISSRSADDVTQDVLLAVLTALPSYREVGNGFLAFVFGIARNKVADFYRERHRDPAVPVADIPDRTDDDDGPERAVLRAELRQKMRELLSTLTEAQQEILVHRVIIGLSSEDSAALLSSTPGAVRVAQHRALEKLRRRLEARRSPTE